MEGINSEYVKERMKFIQRNSMYGLDGGRDVLDKIIIKIEPRFVINSCCFGFNCALKALFESQIITRCDWFHKDSPFNINKFVYLERYDKYRDKNKRFIIYDTESMTSEEYQFTTEDILSDNWCCCEPILEPALSDIFGVDRLKTFRGFLDIHANITTIGEYLKRINAKETDYFLVNMNTQWTDYSYLYINTFYDDMVSKRNYSNIWRCRSWLILN